MSRKARIEKVEKALEPPATYSIHVVWSEEERQALIKKYGERCCIDIYWDDTRQEARDEEHSEKD